MGKLWWGKFTLFRLSAICSVEKHCGKVISGSEELIFRIEIASTFESEEKGFSSLVKHYASKTTRAITYCSFDPGDRKKRSKLFQA